MKVLHVVGILLLGLHAGGGTPTSRWSCNRKVLKDRDCHSAANKLEKIRPIDSLQDHYWEGTECDTVCFCNFRELLCCPRNVFFGPKISVVIPCKMSEHVL
ncbi:scrapie-responsive protein 1-like [Brachyhypopomus gauderio]|uniref:scrapie-responsive protein 1-like n=1 Tax=Brachyhypopomus gauderio TaxID=698409 RepID=UPI004042B012